MGGCTATRCTGRRLSARGQYARQIIRVGGLFCELELLLDDLQDTLLGHIVGRVGSAGLVSVGAIIERRQFNHLAVYLPSHVERGSRTAARTA